MSNFLAIWISSTFVFGCSINLVVDMIYFREINRNVIQTSSDKETVTMVLVIILVAAFAAFIVFVIINIHKKKQFNKGKIWLV